MDTDVPAEAIPGLEWLDPPDSPAETLKQQQFDDSLSLLRERGIVAGSMLARRIAREAIRRHPGTPLAAAAAQYARLPVHVLAAWTAEALPHEDPRVPILRHGSIALRPVKLARCVVLQVCSTPRRRGMAAHAARATCGGEDGDGSGPSDGDADPPGSSPALVVTPPVFPPRGTSQRSPAHA